MDEKYGWSEVKFSMDRLERRFSMDRLERRFKRYNECNVMRNDQFYAVKEYGLKELKFSMDRAKRDSKGNYERSE